MDNTFILFRSGKPPEPRDKAPSSEVVVRPARRQYDGEVVAESRDRYVVYRETENYHTGAEQASWIIKNRHTDDEVFSLDFPRHRVKHSYASEHHVFVALSMADESINAHTVEWLLQDDRGRVRTVQKNGDTRIYDVYASGMTQVRG